MNLVLMLLAVISLTVVLHYLTELTAPLIASVVKVQVKTVAFEPLLRVAIAVVLYLIIRLLPEFPFKFTVGTATAFHIVWRVWALSSIYYPRKPGLLFRLKNKIIRK